MQTATKIILTIIVTSIFIYIVWDRYTHDKEMDEYVKSELSRQFENANKQ